jgi:hypothetical protein
VRRSGLQVIPITDFAVVVSVGAVGVDVDVVSSGA